MRLAGIVAEVSNNTGAPVFDLSYGAVLRDRKGKLLTTLCGDAFDVGVPSGGKLLLRSYIDHYLEAFLRDNDMTPGSVEIVTFTQRYDD